MVQRNSKYVFINDTSSASSATVISNQQNADGTRTLIANYNDPTLYDQPQLQIINDPGGSNTQVQFNNGIGFGGSNNFVYNYVNSQLSLNGNLYVTGNLSANISTNFQNFRITGGNLNQVVSTDGNGNLFWGYSTISPNSDINVNSVTFSDNTIQTTAFISSEYVTFAQMEEYVNNLLNIDGGNASQSSTTIINGGNA